MLYRVEQLKMNHSWYRRLQYSVQRYIGQSIGRVEPPVQHYGVTVHSGRGVGKHCAMGHTAAILSCGGFVGPTGEFYSAASRLTLVSIQSPITVAYNK